MKRPRISTAQKETHDTCELPQMTWVAINMLAKHGECAVCGQVGEAAKHAFVPQSTVHWLWIRLTLASNTGGDAEAGRWVNNMDSLNTASCLISGYDAGGRTNDRSSAQRLGPAEPGL